MPKIKQEYRQEIWTDDSYSRTQNPLGKLFIWIGSQHFLQVVNACLVIVDRYSKTPIFLPCHEDDTAMDTALLLWIRVISHTGLFKNIISERNPKLTYALWPNLHRLFGTKLSFSTAYYPQTNGLAERMIQTLEDMIGRFCAYGLEFKDSGGLTHDWCTLIPAF
ncbi:hypothetical protein O181_060990 [Austropuccinia psidii MF-1]|uniref:Integrase catalytic domain-containing protein n=1 Tax=Austropuccinia psidii MF-1 TaxID=1389203 RepID=A0A9Q3I033_9BASI|nr:hypothetical protein [Austropuccinia psidii MF-1]